MKSLLSMNVKTVVSRTKVILPAAVWKMDTEADTERCRVRLLFAIHFITGMANWVFTGNEIHSLAPAV